MLQHPCELQEARRGQAFPGLSVSGLAKFPSSYGSTVPEPNSHVQGLLPVLWVSVAQLGISRDVTEAGTMVLREEPQWSLPENVFHVV